jgi:hypothetical protein
MLYRYEWLGVYGSFLINAVTAGFVQTILPMMMVDMFKD